MLCEKIEERSIAYRILVRLTLADDRLAEDIDGESGSLFADFAKVPESGLTIRARDKNICHPTYIFADDGCRYRRNEAPDAQCTLEKSGNSGPRVIQIFGEMAYYLV